MEDNDIENEEIHLLRMNQGNRRQTNDWILRVAASTTLTKNMKSSFVLLRKGSFELSVEPLESAVRFSLIQIVSIYVF